MDGETTTVVLVVDGGCFWAVDVESDWAVALMAMASEDPNTWRDLVLVWERHVYPAMPAQFDDLPWEAVDPVEAREALDDQNSWVWIDLVDKRVLASGLFDEIERNDVYSLSEDKRGRECWQVSIDLAPWWELVVEAEPEAVAAPRELPLEVRRTDRDFLYGRPLLEHIAGRVLDFVASDRGAKMDAWSDRTNLYDLVLEVHREWLMTPHPQLHGVIPRTLVHGGADWIDRLGRSQSRRAVDQKGLVALSAEFSNYEVAPMGREEMVAYSDLCREVILEAWRWAGRTFPRGPRVVEARHGEELLAYLQSRAEAWLQTEQDGEAPPALVIECSRRRIPLLTSVPVRGITWPELHGSATDCECPICRWQADQMAGGTFADLSLGFGESQWMELDEEFAFSMYETREEWEEQRMDLGYDDDDEFEDDEDEDWSEASPAEVVAQPVGRVAAEKGKSSQEQDPFAPIWSGVSREFELPDDFAGQLGLTFLMAELVSELKSRRASAEEIRELNERFAERRRVRAGGGDSGHGSGGGDRKEFGDYLEGLASQYPDLIPRLADLQSRI